MIGTLGMAENIRHTHFRFRNNNDYEFCINSIDLGYDSKDAICNGYIYILNMPEFNKANRFQSGKSCDFKHQIIKYQGNNCFIPTKG